MGRALHNDESVEVPGAFTRLYNDEMHSMIIAVDSACRELYRRDTATLGVFFGNNSQWNKSELLPRRDASPRCAQLCSVLRTLQLLQTDIVHEWSSSVTAGKTLNRVIIKSDCRFLVQSMTKDIFKWAEKDYTDAGGKQMWNRDLYKHITDMIHTLERDNGLKVLFWRVDRGHNQDAHRLANAVFDNHRIWNYREIDEDYEENSDDDITD